MSLSLSVTDGSSYSVRDIYIRVFTDFGVVVLNISENMLLDFRLQSG